MLKNSDIRIVHGNIKTVANQLEYYLEKTNHNITQKKMKESAYCITAENKRKAFFKLLWEPKPQITYWQLQKYSDNEIKIKTTMSSFWIFKSYFYGILIFLLTFSGIFFKAAFSIPGDFVYSLKMFFIFAALLFFVCYLLDRLISTNPYKQFISEYYQTMEKNNLRKEQVLQATSWHPDMIPGILFFLIFPIIFFFSIQYPVLTEIILWGALAIIALPFIFIVINFYYTEKTVKSQFVVIAFSFCISLALYGNLPILGQGIQMGFTHIDRLSEKNNLLKEKLRTSPLPSRRSIEEFKETQNMIYKTYTFLCLISALFLIPILFLLMSITYLPIEILRNIERFSTTNEKSLYFQAMNSKRFITPFNCCIIGIWLFLGIANLSGLFLSLAVLGKLAGVNNFIIKSDILDLFYKSSRMMLTYMLPGALNANAVHTFVMLAYAIPVPLCYVLVVGENIKSTLRTILFLKDKTTEKPSAKVTTQIKTICQDCKLRLPITRIVTSEKINEGANYLGFPVFRNLLVVRKQTIDVLGKTDYALNAYLAHEMYHIKKHTLMWKLLCLLSNFSLLGSGFLTILHSSYEIELKADVFAVKWLKRHNMPPIALVSALKAQEELREKEYLNLLLNNLNFTKSVENEEYRQAIIKQCDASSKFKKALINLKLFYQIYFGTYIMSYIHPSNEYRIKLIEENISEAM